MTRWIIATVFAVAFGGELHAQFPGAGGEPLTFKDVVRSVEASVEPATARRGETVTWRLKVDLIEGWHTYPARQPDPNASAQVTKFTFPSSGNVVFVGKLQEPPDPKTHPEPELQIKELLSYEGTVVWERKFVVSPNAPPGPLMVTVPVRLFACKETCLPPKTIETQAKLIVSDDSPVAVDPQYADSIKSVGAVLPNPDVPVPAVTGDYAKALETLESQIVVGNQSITPTNTGLWKFIGTAALWGIVSLFTPCVFPMIPITVSFFLKQSEKQHLNPVLQASVYCGTIVVVLGIAALTLLSVFRDMSVHPATNIILALLFIVLALSLFGMFELTLPNFITRFTSSRESQGGLIGTIFMALTFTVVSFTCVAPFLGGFAGIASSGQFRWWEMVLGAFAFSAAFAAPFFILAMFPSLIRKLPRSGGWLNNVKVVMGFLEIAAALKFLRTAELRLLPQAEYFTYDFVLGLWVALSILCGLYLINVFRIGHDEPIESIGVPRFLFGFLFIGLGFYMMPGIFKTGPEGERNRPTGAVFAWVDAFLLPDGTDLPWTVNLPKAIAEARAERVKTGKPQYVFVDFTGVTCTNCKYNEKSIFSRPEIKGLFKPYKLVQMYTDEVPANFFTTRPTDQQRESEAQANLQFQKRKFGSEQLPLYVILEPLPDGKVQVVEAYKEGKINQVEQFADFLKRPFLEDKSQAAR